MVCYSNVRFTGNTGPAVDLYYAISTCASGLPTNYYEICTTPCIKPWYQTGGQTTCAPPAPTPAPSPAPTPAPTVTPPYPICKSRSPLSGVFSTVTKTVVAGSSAELATALSSITQPTIIQLTGSGATYVLSQSYTINYNLCIQVRRMFCVGLRHCLPSSPLSSGSARIFSPFML